MTIKELQCDFITNYVNLMDDISDIDDKSSIEDLRDLSLCLSSISANIMNYVNYKNGLFSAAIKAGEDQSDILDSYMIKHDTEDIEYEQLGHVYIVSYDGSTKIGISKTPKSRISSLQTANPSRFQKYYVSDKVSNYKEIESKLHSIFKSKKISGEWFKVSFEEAVSELNKITI